LILFEIGGLVNNLGEKKQQTNKQKSNKAKIETN